MQVEEKRNAAIVDHGMTFSRRERLLDDSGHVIASLLVAEQSRRVSADVLQFDCPVEHPGCLPPLGIVGLIASVSSSKPLTAKPDR